jgi:hypothetical protein
MKFLGYLSEQSEIEKKLKKECSKMIDFYQIQRGSFVPFWRGTRRSSIEGVVKKKSHLKDRTPMSTGKAAHEWMNKWFKKKFGWPVRNGVAVSSHFGTAQGYGHPMIFLPVNGFKYAWSPDVNDLWGELVSTVPSFVSNKNKDVDKWVKEFGNDIFMEKDIIPMLESYITTDAMSALRKGNEILFNCKYYYLVEDPKVFLGYRPDLQEW